jgi:hypothetical protein
MNELLISIHIPKTAGTTFGAILQKKYQEKFLYVYNSNISGKYCIGQTLGELSVSQRNEKLYALSKADIYSKIEDLSIECIHGHFPYSFVADATKRFPQVRYVTWVREPEARTYSDYLHFRRNGNTESPERLVQILANRMTDFIGSDLSVFSFIGRTEHFDEDLKRFGITGNYETLNITPETKEDAEVKQLIARAVDKDRLLYEQVCNKEVRVT